MRMLLGGAAINALSLGAAYAQSSDSPVSEERTLDTVVVQGVRSSLESAVDTKRNASQISDVIVSEDVAKLPDENIAEALQRVTGIQITRDRGEGSRATIRGLTQVRTELNGRTLLDPEGERDFELSTLPSEMIKEIRVTKSPTADQAEGGLGGTINVITRQPFDFEERTISASLQGQYSDLADSLDPRVFVMATDKFFDDRLGILGSVAYQKRGLQEQIFETRGWTAPVTALNGSRPRDIRFTSVSEQRERLSFDLATQFEATEFVELFANANYTEFTEERNPRYNLSLPPNNSITNPVVSPSGSVISGTYTGPVDALSVNRDFKSEVLSLAAGGEFQNESMRLYGDLSFSEASADRREVVFRYRSLANQDVSFDFGAGGDAPNVSIENFDVSDPANFGANLALDNERPRDSEEFGLRADSEFYLNSGWLSSIEFGARYTDLTFEQSRLFSRSFLNDVDVPTFVASDNPQVNDIVDGDLFSEISGNYPTDFVAGLLFRDGGLDGYRDVFGLNDYNFLESEFSEVTEVASAVYAKANFEGVFSNLPVSGNFGVRVVKLEQTSTGFVDGSLVSVENDYTEVLPSANIAFDLSDQFVLRFAAAKVLARPDVIDLSSGVVADITGQTATGGNPNLDPFKATQFDASLEYYLPNGGILSVAGFYKDVEAFIQTTTVEDSIVPGLEDEGAVFAFVRPDNGESGEITGFEIGYQQFFDALPEPFDGLGIIANYTYVDASAPIANATNPLTDLEKLSPSSYNLIGLYEKGPFDARLAYNWRDDFLDVRDGFGNVGEFTEGFGQLDASLSYDVAENITLSLQGLNLTGTEIRRFSSIEERTLDVSATDRRVIFGVRANF